MIACENINKYNCVGYTLLCMLMSGFGFVCFFISTAHKNNIGKQGDGDAGALLLFLALNVC